MRIDLIPFDVSSTPRNECVVMEYDAIIDDMMTSMPAGSRLAIVDAFTVLSSNDSHAVGIRLTTIMSALHAIIAQYELGRVGDAQEVYDYANRLLTDLHARLVTFNQPIDTPSVTSPPPMDGGRPPKSARVGSNPAGGATENTND